MIAVVVVVLVAALIMWERGNWRNHKKQLAEAVLHHAENDNRFVDLTEVEALPEPVRRYFHFVLSNGQPVIRQAIIRQRGGFRATPQTSGWADMNAVQYFSAATKAFMWDASIAIMPGLEINVCDSYVNGQGAMNAKLMAIFTVVDAHGDEQLNSSALQRYLAESVWFPTALLPSQGVTWEAVNSNKAKATITGAATTVSLEFEFNAIGEVVSVYAADRYREVNGAYEPTAWLGRFSNYINVEGYLVPSKAEVEWLLKDQRYPYWKADHLEIQYKY